jgi:hypothetical protein
MALRAPHFIVYGHKLNSVPKQREELDWHKRFWVKPPAAESGTLERSFMFFAKSSGQLVRAMERRTIIKSPT